MRASIFYMSYCPSAHVLISIESVANVSYNVIIKLLYNSTVSMVTDVIHNYNKIIHCFVNKYTIIIIML